MNNHSLPLPLLLFITVFPFSLLDDCIKVLHLIRYKTGVGLNRPRLTSLMTLL